MFVHLREPTHAFPLAGEAEAVEAFADRLDPGEPQHAALKSPDAEGAEIPAVKRDGHPHGDDNARRATSKEALRKAALRAVVHGEAGPKDVLEKALEQRWHGAVPERKEEHPMLGPAHVVARL